MRAPSSTAAASSAASLCCSSVSASVSFSADFPPWCGAEVDDDDEADDEIEFDDDEEEDDESAEEVLELLLLVREPMTRASRASFWVARAIMRSSMVDSATSRYTRTCFFCPIRCARSMAWRSTCDWLMVGVGVSA